MERNAFDPNLLRPDTHQVRLFKGLSSFCLKDVSMTCYVGKHELIRLTYWLHCMKTSRKAALLLMSTGPNCITEWFIKLSNTVVKFETFSLYPSQIRHWIGNNWGTSGLSIIKLIKRIPTVSTIELTVFELRASKLWNRGGRAPKLFCCGVILILIDLKVEKWEKVCVLLQTPYMPLKNVENR